MSSSSFSCGYPGETSSAAFLNKISSTAQKAAIPLRSRKEIAAGNSGGRRCPMIQHREDFRVFHAIVSFHGSVLKSHFGIGQGERIEDAALRQRTRP